MRVFAHADEAGKSARARWVAQLQAAGARVDSFSFTGLTLDDGTAVKDLNDFAHVNVDQWEAEREAIEGAFSFAA